MDHKAAVSEIVDDCISNASSNKIGYRLRSDHVSGCCIDLFAMGLYGLPYDVAYSCAGMQVKEAWGLENY